MLVVALVPAIVILGWLWREADTDLDERLTITVATLALLVFAAI